MKILPMETKFFHADGQMERDPMKLKVAFPNFANAPTKAFFLQ